jgi:hypothetical protein
LAGIWNGFQMLGCLDPDCQASLTGALMRVPWTDSFGLAKAPNSSTSWKARLADALVAGAAPPLRVPSG